MRTLRNCAFVLLIVVVAIVGVPRRALADAGCWAGCDCYVAEWAGQVRYIMNCLNSCEQIREDFCEANIGNFCYGEFQTTHAGCEPASCIAWCEGGTIITR
jgi:hypothetical protein